METTSNKTSKFSAAGNGLATVSNGYYNLGLNANQSISSSFSNWSLLSYVGRVAYGYDDKYLLTATIRRDGSSKFQGDNKWSNFPSVSAGWKLSNEQFMKDLDAALQTGFSEVKYFRNYFKAQFGCLPSEYSKTTKTSTEGTESEPL